MMKTILFVFCISSKARTAQLFLLSIYRRSGGGGTFHVFIDFAESLKKAE